jgi:hypothetical protein
MDFQQQLELVRSLQNAQQIEIDLALVQVDKPYNFAGNYFYVFEAPDQTSYIEVKTNATNQPAIGWVKQTGFIQPFTKLYITTPAGQAGTMKVLIASMAPELFMVVDNRSAISLTMNDVLTQLQGDITPENWDTEKTVGTAAVSILAANANRKACTVQAKSTNTGRIYVGFANTVTSSKWVAELLPGMAFSVDDYRGDIYAIADIAAQLVGWGEW